MNEEYDVIILGTGLKECIISGLLSVDGKKVLHIDRNSFYGSDTASLNLKDLYEKFKPGQAPKEELGDYRSYIVDLCPKFIMACGSLVKILVHTRVTRYLDFKVVHGSYVYQQGRLYKMPSTPTEALSSSLMGFFQKRKLRNLLHFVEKFDPDDPKTHKDLKPTMRQTFHHFGLDENTVQNVGHALALQLDDFYLDNHDDCIRIIDAIKLYAYSVQRYGSSPFLYPIYSLSGLPESFARLSAVHGGVYMLNRPVDEILYDADGAVKGIRSGSEVAYCKQLLGEPSYFDAALYAPAGIVARAIFILAHPIKDAEGAKSAQIIIPGKQAGRRSDIYVAVVSAAHLVAPKNKFIAIASTLVETDDPREELRVARQLLGDVEEEFYFETSFLQPTEAFRSRRDGTFMTSGYDATSHFQTVTAEVLRLYEAMSGNVFNLSIHAEPEDVKNLEN